MSDWLALTPSGFTLRMRAGARFFSSERRNAMRFLLLMTLTFAVSAVGFGQQDASRLPVQAKRLPPNKPKPTTKDAMIDHYDFGAQLSALQDSNASLPSNKGAKSIPV